MPGIIVNKVIDDLFSKHGDKLTLLKALHCVTEKEEEVEEVDVYNLSMVNNIRKEEGSIFYELENIKLEEELEIEVDDTGEPEPIPNIIVPYKAIIISPIPSTNVELIISKLQEYLIFGEVLDKTKNNILYNSFVEHKTTKEPVDVINALLDDVNNYVGLSDVIDNDLPGLPVYSKKGDGTNPIELEDAKLLIKELMLDRVNSNYYVILPNSGVVFLTKLWGETSASITNHHLYRELCGSNAEGVKKSISAWLINLVKENYKPIEDQHTP